MALEPVYPDYTTVWCFIGDWYEHYVEGLSGYGEWYELQMDIVSDIDGDYGISGNKVLDRTAGSGQLSFTLRNDDENQFGLAGSYSPGHPNSLPFWMKGMPIQVWEVYGGQSFQVWGGYVQEISPSSGEYGEQVCEIKCADWMLFASTYPIKTPDLIEGGKAYDAVEAIVDLMEYHQPYSIFKGDDSDYFTTYPYLFDMVRANTKALSEFKKVNDSELGYIYVRPPNFVELAADGDVIEVLVIEGRLSRKAGSVDEIPRFITDSSLLGADDTSGSGYNLITESGISLVLDESYAFQFDNNMANLEVDYGGSMINSVTTKVYPRAIDAAATTVLATLDTTIAIGAHGGDSDSVTVELSYRDPSNPATKVSGKNMVTPAGSTDYLFNANAGGTGTDLTANLQVTADYYANKVIYSLHNTGVAGYVTKLQARGKGIYVYNPVEYTIEDLDSQEDYGYYPMTIDMQYQDEVVTGQVDADLVLGYNKDPRTNAKKLSMVANYNKDTMNAFLNYTVGKKIYVQEVQTGVTDSYYIQKIAFSIKIGGLIDFSYELAPARVYEAEYWYLGESMLGEETYLG